MEPRPGFEPGTSSTPWLSYFFEPFIFGHKLLTTFLLTTAEHL